MIVKISYKTSLVGDRTSNPFHQTDWASKQI